MALNDTLDQMDLTDIYRTSQPTEWKTHSLQGHKTSLSESEKKQQKQQKQKEREKEKLTGFPFSISRRGI